MKKSSGKVHFRSSSTFPYFMLVALEAGGFLRGLLLLLLYPLIACLRRELALKLMVMVAFAAVRADGLRVGSAVLPKFFLEDVGLEGFEVLRSRRADKGRRRSVVRVISCLPREMVEGFLKEYLEVDMVFARKLQVFNGYFTGFMEQEEEADFSKEALQIMQDSLEAYNSKSSKEKYLLSEGEKRRWQELPRRKYPKPLIFHDGRIAFRPILPATLSMFIWLPLAFLLVIARSLIFCILPSSLSIPFLALLGMHSRLIISSSSGADHHSSGQLYVSNHRTLLDPLYISAAIGRKVTATTYGIDRLNEALSPIRTIRLTRNREEDKRRMKKLVEEGDVVVVHPEGTTCREPYLLRFSPLFAEVCPEIVPVALESRVTMFYGTSTNRFKFMDPVYFLMNPWPSYEVEIMRKIISTSGAHDQGYGHEQCAGGGGGDGGSRETANRVQREIGKALGFECTRLRRRDKYMMLAGNEGIIVEAGR